MTAALTIHRARLGFSRWRHARPFWGGLWTILGGSLIAYVPATAFKFVFATTTVGLGITVGVIVAVCGLLVWLQPQLRVLLGIVIILMSLLSFITSDFGGLLLGMLLGIVGGSLAIAWAPLTEITKAQHRRVLPWRRRGQALTDANR